MTRAVVTSGANTPMEVEIEGRTMTFDLGESTGGTGTAPTSTEGVSASLAACTVGTLRVYADRKGWDLEGLTVAVDTTYDGPVPSLFELTVGIPDRFDEDQTARLMAIAAKCPVHKILAGATDVRVRTA
ncbi:MAG: OsmC family protein [Solirubrobacterales bacterium]